MFISGHLYQPKVSLDPELLKRIQIFRERLRDAEFQNSARSQELISLQAQLAKIIANRPRTSSNVSNSRKHLIEPLASSSALNLPSIYHLMPHLMDNPDSLTPSLQVSKDRVGGR